LQLKLHNLLRCYYGPGWIANSIRSQFHLQQREAAQNSHVSFTRSMNKFSIEKSISTRPQICLFQCVTSNKYRFRTSFILVSSHHFVIPPIRVSIFETTPTASCYILAPLLTRYILKKSCLIFGSLDPDYITTRIRFGLLGISPFECGKGISLSPYHFLHPLHLFT
jgi:hypothetical protein